MTDDETEYKGHRLVIVQQPGGGSLVEITPFEGGQTLRTLTYQSTDEAIAEAREIVDKSTPSAT